MIGFIVFVFCALGTVINLWMYLDTGGNVSLCTAIFCAFLALFRLAMSHKNG